MNSEVRPYTFFVTSKANWTSLIIPVTASPLFMFIFLFVQSLLASSPSMDSCLLTVQNRGQEKVGAHSHSTNISCSLLPFPICFWSWSSSTQLLWSVHWSLTWVTLESRVFIAMICRVSLPFHFLLLLAMSESHTQFWKVIFSFKITPIVCFLVSYCFFSFQKKR